MGGDILDTPLDPAEDDVAEALPDEDDGEVTVPAGPDQDDDA